MAYTQASSITVSHADILYVNQQIKRDLLALRGVYPNLLSVESILEYHDHACTFLANDAVKWIAYTVEDPRDEHRVYIELRYEISYSGSGPKVGLGGAEVRRLTLPASVRLTRSVAWSQTMLDLSVAQQQEILASTGWGVPGSNAVSFKYDEGTWSDGPTYASGALSAQARKYYGRDK